MRDSSSRRAITLEGKALVVTGLPFIKAESEDSARGPAAAARWGSAQAVTAGGRIEYSA